ncbi:MAG: hypothetical protein JXR10_13820 [Cyclobacteriaceae bacterium]
MNALGVNSVMDLSVDFQMNGSQMKRNVKAAKTDKFGENWVLVETKDQNGQSNTQWIGMKFFQMWLGQIGYAA